MRERGVDGEPNFVSLVTALQHQPWQMHHILIRLKTKERTEGLNVCPASALKGPARIQSTSGFLDIIKPFFVWKHLFQMLRAHPPWFVDGAKHAQTMRSTCLTRLIYWFFGMDTIIARLWGFVCFPNRTGSCHTLMTAKLFHWRGCPLVPLPKPLLTTEIWYNCTQRNL